MEQMQMSSFMAVKSDNSAVLGKFVYFSVSNALVDKEQLTKICESVGLPYGGGKRTSSVDAFRSATGDISDRGVSGGHVYKVYFRDNQKKGDVISRELVKETLGSTTNQYQKLANVSFDRENEQLGIDNAEWDSHIDPYAHFYEAQRLFELYKSCAGRKQLEGLILTFLEQMEAIKISIHGHLYFVPRHKMQTVSVFEDFIEALNIHNQNATALTVNSMHVMDDAKQRDKMAAEFYVTVRKEIEEYQERAEHFLSSGCQSPGILNRWISKIDALEEKKRHYENILRRDLDQINDDFSVLRMFSTELQVRARQLEMKKSA